MPSGCFSLSGEIDVATAPALRAVLRAYVASTSGDVVLDCTELSFLDCSAVGVLVDIRNDLEGRKRRLEFLNVRGVPQLVLEILGVVRAMERAPAPSGTDRHVAA